MKRLNLFFRSRFYPTLSLIALGIFLNACQKEDVAPLAEEAQSSNDFEITRWGITKKGGNEIRMWGIGSNTDLINMVGAEKAEAILAEEQKQQSSFSVSLKGTWYADLDWDGRNETIWNSGSYFYIANGVNGQQSSYFVGSNAGYHVIAELDGIQGSEIGVVGTYGNSSYYSVIKYVNRRVDNYNIGPAGMLVNGISQLDGQWGDEVIITYGSGYPADVARLKILCARTGQVSSYQLGMPWVVSQTIEDLDKDFSGLPAGNLARELIVAGYTAANGYCWWYVVNQKLQSTHIYSKGCSEQLRGCDGLDQEVGFEFYAWENGATHLRVYDYRERKSRSYFIKGPSGWYANNWKVTSVQNVDGVDGRELLLDGYDGKNGAYFRACLRDRDGAYWFY